MAKTNVKVTDKKKGSKVRRPKRRRTVREHV
jgi:hypothetical protein